MTNEEKAKEIFEKYEDWWALESSDVEKAVSDSVMEMAEWKEEQMTKNAIDFIVKTIPCTDGFIEEFISAMKGE